MGMFDAAVDDPGDKKKGLFSEAKPANNMFAGAKEAKSFGAPDAGGGIAEHEPTLPASSGDVPAPTLLDRFKSNMPDADPQLKPGHLEGAEHLDIGSRVIYGLYNVLNKMYGKTVGKYIADPTSKFIEANQGRLQQTETIIPGKPIESAVKSVPSVAGQSLLEFADKLIPKSLGEWCQLWILGKMSPAAMDEVLAAGSAPVMQSAPNASHQMLRSILELEDKDLKTQLLKKTAPVWAGKGSIIGTEAADKALSGLHDVEPTVEAIFKEHGPKAKQLFDEGLKSLDADQLKQLGGKKAVEAAKKNLTFQELVRNFSPYQQRMIMRRGLNVAEGVDEQMASSLNTQLNQPQQMPEDVRQLGVSLAVKDTLKQTSMAKPDPTALANLDAALNARVQWSQPLKDLVSRAQKLGEDAQELFEFYPRLKKYPQLQHDLGQLQGYPIQASREATSMLGAITEILPSNEEFETFRKMILLNDWKEGLEDGLKAPNNISLNEVNEALAKLNYTSNVLEASERHYEVVKAMGEDLVKRGYLTDDVLKAKYFNHKILSYLDESANYGAKGDAARAPLRTYTLPRTPNAELIDTDYLKVMHRLFTKVKIDNAVDDLMRTHAGKLDALPGLGDEIRKSLFGEVGVPKVGMAYEIDGKQFLGFRYNPKGLLYPAQSKAEEIIGRAVDQSMTADELDARLKPLNDNLELRKVYLLPREVADSLVKFQQPQELAHLYDLIKHPVRLWKRMTLTAAGIPWQMKVFQGSIEALYREGDYEAIARIPQAWGKLGKSGLSGGELDPILKKAQEAGIATGFAPLKPEEDPQMLKFFDLPEKLKQVAMAPAHLYDFMSQTTVGAPKLAKFMADTARIQKGIAVQTNSFGPELEGLSKEAQVIRANKLTLVEFATNNKRFNSLFRDFLTPFISFQYHNLKGWAKYSMRNPGDLAVKFGGLYAGMQYWNWKQFPEVERDLPSHIKYSPHVITGWKDEDGRYITISYHSTGMLAAKWVAADKLMHRASQVAAGQMDLNDAIQAQAKDVTRAPLEQSYGLLNPALSSMVAIATNKKKADEGGGPVVPEHLKGTQQGTRLQQEYLLNNLLTPLATWERTTHRQEATPANPMLRFLRYGPLDYEKAAGVSRVDLEKAERSMRATRSEEAKVLNNQHYANIEDAYVKSQVSGDWKEYTDSLETADKIPLPSGKSLSHYLKAPRVQLRVLRDKLSKSQDPTERQDILQQIKGMEEGQSGKAIKGAPRQERDFILEGQ